MDRLSVSIGSRFSEVEAARLQAIADREQRTVSNVVRLLVRRALAELDKREQPEA